MQSHERKPVRKRNKSMMILLGSGIALIGSLCAWTKGRNYLSFLASHILLEFRYQVLGITDLYRDFRNAKYNRTETVYANIPMSPDKIRKSAICAANRPNSNVSDFYRWLQDPIGPLQQGSHVILYTIPWPKALKDLPRRTGCVAVVTGGSRGIGVEVIKMLMKCDMEIILACRNTSAGEKVIEDIRASGVKDGKARVYELDNSSLESVRKFSRAVKNDYSKIDILINNAGIMFTPYAETMDGFEEQWGVNYLSHFLLTALLLPLLKNAGNADTRARIINVTSCAQVLGQINFEDVNQKDRFLTGAAYAQSKLASVMFTTTLQRFLQDRNIPVQIFAVHPGIVDTDLFRNTIFKRLKTLTKLLFKSPKKGATGIVYAAVSEKIENSGGLYLTNCRNSSMNRLAKNHSACERLFKLSLEQVKLNDFFEYL